MTYTPQDLIRCEVRGDAADEQLVGGGVQAVARYTVRMRYRTDVTERNRLRRETDGLTLDILGVADPTGRREELVLACAKALTA